jgi:hypothetical protein
MVTKEFKKFCEVRDYIDSIDANDEWKQYSIDIYKKSDGSGFVVRHLPPELEI